MHAPVAKLTIVTLRVAPAVTAPLEVMQVGYGNQTSSSPSSLKWGNGPTSCPITFRLLFEAMAANEDRKLAETSQSTTITYTTTTSCSRRGNGILELN